MSLRHYVRIFVIATTVKASILNEFYSAYPSAVNTHDKTTMGIDR